MSATSSAAVAAFAKFVETSRHEALERTFRRHISVEVERLHAPKAPVHLLELVAQPGVAKCVLDLRLLHDKAQLGSSILRYRRYRNAARFQDGKPARCQHRRVRRAKQDAISWLQRRRFDEHVGDAIGRSAKIVVAPTNAAGRDDAAFCAFTPLDTSIEETRCRIQDGPDNAAPDRSADSEAHAPAAGDRARTGRDVRSSHVAKSCFAMTSC